MMKKKNQVCEGQQGIFVLVKRGKGGGTNEAYYAYHSVQQYGDCDWPGYSLYCLQSAMVKAE